jgi:S1-C subfamily serine protease
VKQVMADLRRGRSRGWAGFGIEVPKRSQLAREHLPAGVLIGSALPGTPAYAAGLRGAPVLVTQINGFRIDSSLASYCSAVDDVTSGQTAVLSVVPSPRQRPQQLSLRFK